MIMMAPRAFRRRSIAPIHAGWIVHQNAGAYRGVWTDLAEQVHQLSVVRHVLGDVGMRPVRTPEDTRRIDRNQRLRERHRITEGPRAARDALGAADLDPRQRVGSEQ